MNKTIFFIYLMSVILSYSITTGQMMKEQGIPGGKTEGEALPKETNPEVNDILQQSQDSKNTLPYNTYITGELKTLKVEIDLFNSKIYADGRYILVPMRIINKSDHDFYLNSIKDKLFLIFRRQTGYESYQLQLLNFPEVILPGKDIIFAGKYNFKNYDERLGIEISLKFLKMIVDGLNSGGGKLKKNELANMEQQMQYNWGGKFQSETYGITIPLEYKIEKK